MNDHSKLRFLVANWKMNLLPTESAELALSLLESANAAKLTQVWIAPSTLAISEVARTLGLGAENIDSCSIKIGAQNVHWELAGSYTGEVSVPMLRACGCSFSIVGHSERRHVFGESNDLVHRRALFALRQGMSIIFCVGETIDQRQEGQTVSVLRAQLLKLFSDLDKNLASRLILAYEPVWAIGSGQAASLIEIEEAHLSIQSLWSEKLSEIPCAPILYGGSVSPENYGKILSLPCVSGGLVGKASLSKSGLEGLLHISETV